MKVGDIFKIESNGFIKNPEVKVLEIKDTLVKIIPTKLIGKNGLLSHLSETWTSVDLLESKKLK